MYLLRTEGKWVFINLTELTAYSNFLDAQEETDFLVAEKNRITKCFALKSGVVIRNFNDIPLSEDRIYTQHQ